MPLYMDLHSNLGRATKFMTALVIMLGLAATPASADTGCEYAATFESILEGVPGSEASGLASLLAQAAAGHRP